MSLSLKEFRSLHKLVDEIYAEARRMDWSWWTLANKADLSYNTVCRLGNYDTVFPRASTVFQLARAVGFSITLVKAKHKLKIAG